MENPTSQACIDDPVIVRQSWQHRHETLGRQTHIDLDLLPVRVLNRGIIALDPDILDELRWQESQKEALKGWRTLPVRHDLPTPPRSAEIVSCETRPPEREKSRTCAQHDDVIVSPARIYRQPRLSPPSCRPRSCQTVYLCEVLADILALVAGLPLQ